MTLQVHDTENNGFTIFEEDYAYYASIVKALQDICYKSSDAAGWHKKSREIGTGLMLIVSEIAEAMEGDRKNLMDDHLPHRKMFDTELADALIRIFDIAGKQNAQLGEAFAEKLCYNQTREDHKIENREKEHGKKY